MRDKTGNTVREVQFFEAGLMKHLMRVKQNVIKQEEQREGRVMQQVGLGRQTLTNEK